MKKKTIVQAGIGIGHSELDFSKTARYILGYYQTFRTLEEPRVKKKLMSIRPKFGLVEIEEYAKIAKEERPLVVHLRLTDYENEDKFGIPNQKYYLQALSEIKSFSNFRRIWIFTDDKDGAMEYLPKEITDGARWIPQVAGSSACTLEVMRYGASFIIGNSSFSWWGASLSYEADAVVVSPQPWFKFMNEPKDLIPKNWRRIPAWGSE